MPQTTYPLTATAIRWQELVLDADAFAGEDEAWADEDLLPAEPEAEQSLPTAFFTGLMVALSLAAVGWALLAAAAAALYRLVA